MAKLVKNLKLSDSVLLQGEGGVGYSGVAPIEVHNANHTIGVKTATERAQGVLKSASNTKVTDGAISVNLDKAATAASKSIYDATLGEIFSMLGGTVDTPPTSGFTVNGTAYTTWSEALTASRAATGSVLDIYEDVTIAASELYPAGSSNNAGIVFANSQNTPYSVTVNGHGHKISFSTFAYDGILVAGYAAAQAKNMLTVNFNDLEIECTDNAVFRAFQVANATVNLNNVKANSKKKNIIGINGGVVTIDGGSALTYDGGWEPIGIDNGTGTDGASCSIYDATIKGMPSDKAMANVENGKGTVSTLAVYDGEFDTLPNNSGNTGVSITISGGRFKNASWADFAAYQTAFNAVGVVGYAAHNFADGTNYAYGVEAV